MENIIENYLKNSTYENMLPILNYFFTNKCYNIVIFISKFFLKNFNKNINFLIYLSDSFFLLKKYRESYNYYDDILDIQNIEYDFYLKILEKQSLCIKHISDEYIYYDFEKIKQIEKNKNNFSFITFTITTCKRYDLFEKTINSFINCCMDIEKIGSWICVDDNSSEEDRSKMKEKYPFFDFYFKNLNEKGHSKSMNIIYEKVKTPYIFHMEDDWKFFSKKKYMSICLDILENKVFSQCLINKNYAETIEDLNLIGGIKSSTVCGEKYLIHDKLDQELFIKKYGQGKNCSYWPHFSLRPSLLKTKNIKDVGKFQEILNFEIDFANRYYEKKNISTFLDRIHCIHIGRLTTERFENDKKNAYILNNEKQFIDKIIFKTIIINLDKRPDRFEKIKKEKQFDFLEYLRFPAVDGSKIFSNPQLEKIFEGNDYNMKQGMVGCALSHIKIYIDFINTKNLDVLLILEDDIICCDNFKQKFMETCEKLFINNWDICYIGHHNKYPEEKNTNTNIKKYTAQESLNFSIGGTFSYLISKQGAKKLLEIINTFGMINCIDTIQQKSADFLSVYYCYPSLIYCENFFINQNIDTDIQKNQKSVKKNPENNGIIHSEKRLFKNGKYDINDCLGI